MAKSAPAPLHVVILAAGQGTRMKSALPKVLQPIAGKAMLGHVIDAASALGAAGIHLVIGHGAEQVQYWARAQYGKDAPLHWAYQAQQLGTAHAVLQALPQIPQQAQVLVLYGDVPLVSLSALQNLCAAGTRALALMSVTLADASGYGRILRNRAGAITGIVEDKEASAKQKLIREINTGLLSVPAAPLRRWLPKVKNDNAKGEYYLTDIVAMAVKGGMKVQSVGATPEEVEGANDRLQLARLERYYQLRQAEGLMRDGLSLADPARFDLRGTLKAGRDVKIDVGCVLEGAVELGDGVQLGACCVLRNVRIAAGSIINTHSVLEDCEIGPDCRIGPFARIRPDSVLGAEAHVGNFVELKNAKLGPGAKANHLAYVGDAQVGGKTNIGAGVITCNYDGANKHQTVIGEDVFVGSDTQLVAPVRVGDGATIAAGSTITRDVPPGGLTIARAREQKTVPGWKRPRKQKRE